MKRNGFPIGAVVCALLPAVALAGTIPVNSPADGSPQNDAFITLREAMLIAAGARVPFDHPDPDVLDEARYVTGSCGAGLTDSIHLPNEIIGLTSELPAFSDPGDEIRGGSLTSIIDALALPGNQPVFLLSAGNQGLSGMTIRNAPGPAVEITSPGNTVAFSFLENSLAGPGLKIHGAEAVGNMITSVVCRNNGGNGVEILDGSSGNTVNTLFSYGNDGNGFLIRGVGTSGNVLYSLGAGWMETLGANYSGNGLRGIVIDQGASGNRIGNPQNDNSLSGVVANKLGGIRIEGEGTDGNLLHTIFIGGVMQSQPSTWVGNGTGRGIEVINGAKNNQIGKAGQNCLLVLGGHQNDAVYCGPTGTDGNTFQRIFIGTWNPQTGRPIPNAGHGIVLEGGIRNTRLGGRAPLTQIQVDHCGDGKSGIFLNGNDPANAMQDIDFGVFHNGNDAAATGQPSFPGGGNVITITGNVDRVNVGEPGHPNDANGASGYGVVLDGPNVRNIYLRDIHAGDAEGTPIPNTLGGLLIKNGAHDIVVGNLMAGPVGGEHSMHSVYSGNLGPGITIDARGTPPARIQIVNSQIGLSPSGQKRGNGGDGIKIFADPGTSPVVLDSILIGGTTAGDRCYISGNGGNGISLVNVGGVKIYKNYIGTDMNGLTDLGNTLSGISLDFAETVFVGRNSSTELDAGNVISGNLQHGIEVKNASRNIVIYNNIIGADSSGNSVAVGNGGDGIHVAAPGPPVSSYVIIGNGNDYFAAGSGTPGPGEGNIISGNDGNGIALDGTSGEIRHVTIQGNQIGASLGGNIAIANQQSGILLKGQGVKDVLVGDREDAYLGNLISGNKKHGVEIVDKASGWSLERNVIGLTIAREEDLGNTLSGILLNGAGTGSVGRTSAPFVGNVISGNDDAGIHITGNTSFQTTIGNNLIGTNGDGTKAVGNRDGILVDGDQTTTGRLAIGGVNSKLAADKAGLEGGNLISGNMGNGVRIEQAGASPKVSAIDLHGNVIGLNLAGTATLPNALAGILCRGGAVRDINIGAPSDRSRRNLVSASKQDGVEIAAGAEAIRLYGNAIGRGLKDADAFGNERHGVYIHEAAKRSLLEENRIWHNKENGVRIADAGTDFNKLTNNSIHRNLKDGIRVLDGANGGIKAPVLDRKFRPGRPKNAIPGRTGIPNATVEVFFDPPVREPGYWGQGKERKNTQSADGQGAIVVPLNGTGIASVTATDAEENTSEFSKWIEPVIVQNVATDEDLFAAGKKTSVRLFADTGEGGFDRRVTAELKLDGTAMAPVGNVQPTLRGYAFFDDKVALRKQGEESINFLLPPLAAGAHTLEATISYRGEERARVDMGSRTFQTTKSPGLAVAPVFSQDTSGVFHMGDPTVAMDLLNHFVAVYPVDTAATIGKFRMFGVIPYAGPIRGSDAHRRVALILDAFGSMLGSVTASEVAFCHGLISNNAGIYDDDGTSLNGFGYQDLTKQTVGRDRMADGMPRTGTFLHEIGHKHPFELGDTYENGDPSDRNPLSTTAGEFDDSGNFVLERFRGYDVTGFFQFGAFRGPVWHAQAYGADLTVNDFMSNARHRWLDQNEARVIFLALGGAVPGGKAIDFEQAQVDNPLIVAGTIDTVASTGSLLPLRRPEGSIDGGRATTGPQEYRVELLDGSGTVLDAEDFGVASAYEVFTQGPDGEDSGAYRQSLSPFRIVLQDSPAATTVVLKKGGAILDSITKSANAPAVEIVSPNGPGELPAGLVTVTWTASDADSGDEARLSYDILYTPDGGTTRIPLQANIAGGTSAPIYTDTLPTGAAPHLIIRVTDGFNEAEAMNTVAFARSNQPPLVHISAPMNGDTLREDIPTQLLGLGYDPETYALTGESLAWYLDGATTPFATGTDPVLLATPGPHTIRLVATDPDGRSSFKEITVNATPRPLDAPGIANFIDEAGDPPATTDANGDQVVDAADVTTALK